MDNRRGRALYRFDMSLMERLSTSGLAMSRIDVQRRMRPEISSLIRFVYFPLLLAVGLINWSRNTLYPTLEDHELVCRYPDVRGIQKNLFFVDHKHKENDGGDDNASKYNTYEVTPSSFIIALIRFLTCDGQVAMITDLVLYLLRLGSLCFSMNVVHPFDTGKDVIQMREI